MKLLIQQVNRSNGQPKTLIPDLVNCGDIHAYIDEKLTPDIVLTISSISLYDEADIRKDEDCHQS